ncbi:MAG: F0F1 ATP synthase subunit A [Candidatus Hydrogenedentota bacterium]
MTSEELLHHIINQRFGPIVPVGALHFQLSQHLLMLWIAAAFAILFVALAARQRRAGGGRIAAAAELFILAVRDGVVMPALGHHYGPKYLKFFLSIALLILFSNLLGLIPAVHIGHFVLGGTATSNFWINLGLATLMYVFGIFCAIREHGVGGYVKSFLPHGIPILLAPLIWIIEFAGIIIKHGVLAIRLTANMIAGHLVIFAILGMIIILGEMMPSLKYAIAAGPVLLALAIFMLELLVAFIQTAVFTILSAIFFGMAVNPHH